MRPPMGLSNASLLSDDAKSVIISHAVEKPMSQMEGRGPSERSLFPLPVQRSRVRSPKILPIYTASTAPNVVQPSSVPGGVGQDGFDILTRNMFKIECI